MKRYTPTGVPIAERNGGVGIHEVRVHGQVYIAAPVTLAGNRYLSPMVQQRRHWEELRRAGGRAAGPSEKPILRCDLCHVGVGQGYVHTSVYLVPELQKDHGCVDWRMTCSTCAVLDLELPYGYCLLAENDWGDCAEQGIGITLTQRVLEAKITQLEQRLLPLWWRARNLAEEANLLPEWTTPELENVFLQLARNAEPSARTLVDLAA
jgi:hypothetical protein